MLNMAIEKVIDHVNPVVPSEWKHTFDTNCYAFALGLDIPEEDICRWAYQPGYIAAQVNHMNTTYVEGLPVIDRMILDLKVLKLGYERSHKPMPMEVVELMNGFYRFWDIAIYDKHHGEDFHFVRLDSNGNMINKHGYMKRPVETNPEVLKAKEYEFVRRIRITQFVRDVNHR